MPITRRSRLRSRSATVGAVSMVAFLAMPAAPATAALDPGTGRDCAVGDFTAHARADLARITVLDPGPLAEDLPALADVRLASAEGTVDSAARPYRSIATGRHADALILGLPAGGAGARHAAPSRRGPDRTDLVPFRVAGLATAGVGRSTAHATWDDAYRCGKAGPLTRSATMLGALSVLDGSGGDVPAMQAGGRRTSLLRVGPTGSTQSATDLVHLGNGRTGVRAGAGVSIGDLALFAGTPQEISVKVVSQPTLDVVAGGDRRADKVTYRPAVLQVAAAGRPAHVLKDSGAVVSLGLLGGVGQGSPAALEVRVSLGEVGQSRSGRQIRAQAAALRVEVKAGMTHLLDVTLGHLSVVACAPAAVRNERPRPRGGGSPATTPAGIPQPASQDVDVPAGSPDMPDSPVSPSVAVPDAVPEPSGAAEPSGPAGAAEPAGPSGPSEDAGDLALTGADVTLFGFAGAGLVMAGLLSLLLTRRRPARN
jgi:hypothetical protein